MEWLSADIVFDGYSFFKKLYLQVDASGRIVNRQTEKPKEAVKHYKGLLMPGMINAHCHLELSHTKDAIEQKTGLPDFLQKVNGLNREAINPEEQLKAMQAADAEMYKNGIVAVGDICNKAESIAVKKKSKIHYHNFVECIAIREQDAERRFAEYQEVLNQFKEANLSTSFALHAPYTCNEKMYELVNENSNFISIHNQESEAENLLFGKKEGAFDNFYKNFGLDKNEIIKQEISSTSFKNSNRLLGAQKKKLFVHNTFTTKNDIESADANSYWCFCPKANLYIENQLPDANQFLQHQKNIVLGTDSLASNDSLNILSEAKTIQDKFPKISLEKILQWTTINGAKLFGLEKEFGSFEVGKKPSFIQVENFDIERKILISAQSKNV